MKVKGTAVESIPVFLKNNHADQYDQWLDSLSPAAKEIFSNPILSSSWYPLKDALIDPTQKICDLLYNGKDTGAWKAGEYSAEKSLTGVYKVFVKVGTPQFIIKRAGTIFSAFYKPSKMEVIESSAKHVVLAITEFPMPHAMIECRIAGWIQRALEINGCKNPVVKITESMTKGKDITRITCNW